MKTLKSLMTVNQALQSQGINRTHWGIGFKKVVPEEEGDSDIGYEETTTSIIVFWVDRESTENVFKFNF